MMLHGLVILKHLLSIQYKCVCVSYKLHFASLHFELCFTAKDSPLGRFVRDKEEEEPAQAAARFNSPSHR